MSKPVLALITLCFVSTSALAQIPKLGADTSAKVTADEYAHAKAEVVRGTYMRGLWRSVKTIQQGSPVTGPVKDQANALINEADRLATEGNNGAAYPLLMQGLSLLTEVPWTPQKQYGVSLVLSSQTLIADQATPLLVTLGQRFVMQPPASSLLRMRTSLIEAPFPPLEALDGVGNMIPLPNKPVKSFWTDEIVSKDLISSPLTAEVDVSDVAEGNYLVKADILDGTQTVVTLTMPITIIHNLAERTARMEQKLAQVQGHDSAKASARYPFNLVRAVNGWRREVPFNINIPAAFAASEALADQLAQGHDPLYQAKGDHKRHYWLAAAGEILPYRIYVPAAWDRTKKLPMVVNLHGGGGNEDEDFDKAPSHSATLASLAEQFNVIVVSVSAYRPNGGYGAIYFGPPVGRPGMWPQSPAKSVPELSEMDTLNVMDLVAQEYNVDRARTYLVGNSMGGGGVWHLASKYPERFAAAAPCASSMDLRKKLNFPFDRLKTVPTMAVVGEHDEGIRKAVAHYGVDELKKRGGTAELVEVKGGIHTNSWRLALGSIFEFFLKYNKSS